MIRPRSPRLQSRRWFLDPGNATAKAGQARSNADLAMTITQRQWVRICRTGAGRLEKPMMRSSKRGALKPNGAEASEGLRRVGRRTPPHAVSAVMRPACCWTGSRRALGRSERTYEEFFCLTFAGLAQEGRRAKHHAPIFPPDCSNSWIVPKDSPRRRERRCARASWTRRGSLVSKRCLTWHTSHGLLMLIQ